MLPTARIEARGGAASMQQNKKPKRSSERRWNASAGGQENRGRPVRNSSWARSDQSPQLMVAAAAGEMAFSQLDTVIAAETLRTEASQSAALRVAAE